MIRNLFIATPAFRSEVTLQYMYSIQNTATALASRGTNIIHSCDGGDSMVHISRNSLVAKGLAEPQVDAIMFIDADIGWKHEDAVKLVEHAESVDCVCGFYVKKRPDVQFAGNLVLPINKRGALWEVKDAPPGFMILTRKALQDMIAAYPDLHALFWGNVPPAEAKYSYALFDGSIDPETKLYLREDFTFSRRFRAIGKRIWVDPNIQLSHQGMGFYSAKLTDFKWE